MTTEQITESQVQISVRNIGGIEKSEVTIPPGVSILTGRNATNRTSFLTALMAGLGSEQASLKGDTEKGSVTLDIGEETYTRTLTRHDDTVSFDGDPYLNDPELADLFAFLLENNEARRTVARGDDLREIIMRPIDTDRIDAEIESCRRKREEVDNELQQLEQLEQTLPELEEKRHEKEAELEEVRDKFVTVQAELEEIETGVEQSRSRKQELEKAFQRVRDARSELEDLEFKLETERSTLSELSSEREELEETLAETEPPEEDPNRLEGRIQELRSRKRALDDTISQLANVVSFNEDMLEKEGLGIVETDTEESADLTDALTANENVSCWTCGSTVGTEQIETTLDQLRDLRSEKLEERNNIESQVTKLTNKRSSLRNKRQEIEQAEDQLRGVEDEIEATNERITELENRIETKRTEIGELENEAESIEVEDHDEVLELHRKSNELELQVDRLEDDLGKIDEEIAEREKALEERGQLEAEREELTERLTDLRTRVERIEKDAVTAFNDHMETVLDILEYDNLDRIWIERRQEEVREGRRKVTKNRFELHIVRAAADGSAYEDTIDHLSESEREVTGLVFALAGYLVHDVHEVVPFVLLDSLEAIDSDRIRRLVDYFSTHADYLISALLPEDAEALSSEYTYVTSID
ncbi:archaea-specific SMC-related protein [Halorubrum aethiopicum]|uniref:archaea-specific SMC-related protein n=1 Tax=Halorubrum aethiopicum TaxID=1758255 RepID=UPI00082E0DA6|nr:archaea-specific SMC-related protein [Halorubrum aethiopicum]